MSWPVFWTENRWQTKLLWPLSKLVCWEAARRLRRFQQTPPARQTQATVIVVGNVVVGGSGKTPFIIWLTRQLQSQGLTVGIISRGYGGQSKQWPLLVTADSDPQLVGDEPVLLAKQLGCPIAVSPKRPQAIQRLNSEMPCDVIISDDGLQHYALARDIEVVLIDSQRQFGNQFCLPSGPLREPLSRLSQVDFCVWNGLGKNETFPTKLDTHAQFKMRLNPLCFRQVMAPENSVPVTAFATQTVNAIAGIGNPERFFDTLTDLQLSVSAQPFADHYDYQLADFQGFSDENPLIMTEKDAVKCTAIAQAHQKANWWYLEVAPDCDDGLLPAVLQRLKSHT